MPKVIDIKGPIITNDDKWIYDWFGVASCCPADYRYIAILTEYYINCQRWEDIAESMEMSVRHTLRLHGEALQVFRKKFDFP